MIMERTCVSALADLIELACLMEASARKPGNVHPGASFVDLCYEDFVQAAATIAPIVADAKPTTIGATVLRAIEATQQHARSNINLGIVLLFTPLAAIHKGQSIAALREILRGTTQRDAADVYRAIRLAVPGGLGEVDDQDVADEPQQTLLEVMQLAADRDLIAAQYAHDFALVQALAGTVAHRIQQRALDQNASAALLSDPPMPPWEAAVITLFLELVADLPDSLIVRKNDSVVAQESQRRARAVIETGWPLTPEGAAEFQDFDAWLRADGHRRNPGTSADLIAAALFVALRSGWITPPTRSELTAHAAAIRQAPN